MIDRTVDPSTARLVAAHVLFGVGTGACAGALMLIIVGLATPAGSDPHRWLWMVLPPLAALAAAGWRPTQRLAAARGIIVVVAAALAVAAIAVGIAPARRLLAHATAEQFPDAALSNADAFTLAGAALGLLVAVATGLHAAVLGWDPDRMVEPTGRRVFGATALAVLLVLPAGVALPRVADAVTVRLNTRAQSAGRLGAAHPSTLNGAVRWASDERSKAFSDDPYSGQVLATSGGMAVVLQDGVRMLDGSTGAERWRWQRSDVTVDNMHLVMHASPDGDRLALRISAADSDRYPQVPGVIVFDTRSGEVLGSIDPGGALVAVTETSVVTAATTDQLDAWDFGGHRLWSTPLDGDWLTHARGFTSAAGTLLVNEEDDDDYSHQVEAVDLRTGSVRWLRDDQAFAVAGHRVGVQYEHDRATLTVTGVRLGDGEELWEQRFPAAETEIGEQPCFSGADVEDGSVIVLSCQDRSGPDDQVRIAGIEPETGTVLWRQQIRARIEGSIEAWERVQALPDGSAALIGAAEEGCELITVGRDGERRVFTDDLDARGVMCGYQVWTETRGTYVLDRYAQRGTRLHALQ